jgi:hypothetical protein
MSKKMGMIDALSDLEQRLPCNLPSDVKKRMKQVFDRVIALHYAAQQAVEEFDTYGEVWQFGKGDNYGSDTALGALRKAIKPV